MEKSITKLRNGIEEILSEIPVDFGGGCSVSKATVMCYLLQSQKIKNSIDIGIYRGRSFIPQALTHSQSTGGVVYGVDPYTKGDAMEHDHKELKKEIEKFAKTTDFDELFKNVNSILKKHGLQSNGKIVRKTSDKAVSTFIAKKQKYGLIHIDGNHDTKAVISDVNHYVDLLDRNGFIILDDISWRSVRPAVDIITNKMTLLYARVDTQNDYAVFWNGTNKTKKYWLRHMLSIAGEGLN